jgi:Anti-sigma factor NepR
MTPDRPRHRPRPHPGGVARRPDSGNAAAPRLEAQIGEHLRRHYASLLHEPIPDRLVALLQDLGSGRGGA